MAPEQWISGSIGAHTDVFHLGLALYTWLTGQVLRFNPFLGYDIAFVGDSQLTRICEKLLAYSSLDRYATLDSIYGDLSRCLAALKKGESIPYFVLDATPSSDQLLDFYVHLEAPALPVASIWKGVVSGRFQLTLISGSPGVGKTSFVHHQILPVVDGLWWYSKFSQWCAPLYQPIFLALGEWLVTVKKSPRYALFQPDIDALLIQLDIHKESSQCLRILMRLMDTVCKIEPGVLCLDDLQWTDSGTLEFLEECRRYYPHMRLWVIVLYRPESLNDVARLWLSEMAATGFYQIQHLALVPFDAQRLSTFLADFFHFQDPQQLPHYTAQLMTKTGGTPFLVKQFLLTQISEGFLRYDSSAKAWAWDLGSLIQTPIMDTAVQVVAQKTKELPTQTQSYLSVAACIGTSFDLGFLATLLEVESTQVALHLFPANTAHIIAPGSASSYRFLHDTLHATFLGFLSGEMQSYWHDHIGHAMEKAKGYPIAQVASHYFLVTPDTESPTRCCHMARILLDIGKEALFKTGYGQALDYFKRGLCWVDHLGWALDFDLVFHLHFYLARALFLAGHEAEAHRCFDLLTQQAVTDSDCLKIIMSQIELYQHVDQQLLALTLANQAGLSLNMGFWGQITTPIKIFWEYFRLKWVCAKPVTLTPATEHEALYHHFVQTSLPAAYLVDPRYFVQITLKACRRILTSGYSPYSMGTLTFTSLTVMHGMKNMPLGIQLSELARQDQWASPETEITGKFMLGAMTMPYYRPLQDCVLMLEKTVQQGQFSANTTHTSYGADFLCFYHFLLGTPLHAIKKQIQVHLDFAKQAREKWSMTHLHPFLGMILRLQGDTADASDVRRDLPQGGTKLHILLQCFFEALPLYIEGAFDQAYVKLSEGRPFLGCGIGMMHGYLFDWLYALAALWQYPTQGLFKKVQLRRRIQKTLAEFERLATYCSDTFRFPLAILRVHCDHIIRGRVVLDYDYRVLLAACPTESWPVFRLIALDLARRNPALEPCVAAEYALQWAEVMAEWRQP